MDAATDQLPVLFYVHDPMCSWCWAFSPALAEMEQVLGDEVAITRVLGGLAPDSDQPMPEDMRHHLEATWERIQDHVPGTRFNFDFWRRCTPRRSTWPACRAVIAARRQGAEHDRAMTRAIQQAYYLEARNPSDTDTVEALAGEIGLDSPQFARDLADPEVAREFERERMLCQQLGVQGFPTMVLVLGRYAHGIAVDYGSGRNMADNVRRAAAELEAAG